VAKHATIESAKHAVVVVAKHATIESAKRAVVVVAKRARSGGEARDYYSGAPLLLLPPKP
jgi:hypothetical protein